MKVICPKCNKEAPWVSNALRYGRKFGKSYMCYYCRPCGTYVGCHENTRRPLGTMADQKTMTMRKEAHLVLDRLWKSGQYQRKTVYRRLSETFGEEIHIGLADIEKCREIIKTIPLIFQKQDSTEKTLFSNMPKVF